VASYSSFEELNPWQKCRKGRIWVNYFQNTRIDKRDFDMPQNRKWATRWTTRHIAEGFGRFYFNQYAHYLSIGRGALSEIKDDLIIYLD